MSLEVGYGNACGDLKSAEPRAAVYVASQSGSTEKG